MDYEKLFEKKNYVRENFHLIPKEALENYERAFDIQYAHNSTAIEGNTLTLAEVSIVLDDKISIAGKDMREIHEVENHQRATDYVRNAISEKKSLDEKNVKDVHALLMENIFVGGVYRDVPVYIKGAVHVPPSPQTMFIQIKAFYEDLQNEFANAITCAAWTHAQFVKIHPFIDGNGRTSRMIMNYQLMLDDWLPIDIPKEMRLEYFDALDKYATEGDLSSFVEIIADLEEKQLDWYIEAINCVKERGANSANN
ncbi:MAG: Fic family protein [Oscillospiraceae bacterium]|nr:Fic family protein [Oscillospiraceae bacterium]